jgi:DNA-binding XRE family transcriptional regulator
VIDFGSVRFQKKGGTYAMKQFKNHLYRLRRIRGYSQKTLARLLGVRKRNSISAYESGKCLPQLAVGMLMEIVLGARLSEIYPDLYRTLGLQAVDREDSLPPRFSRHVRGRVLGKD